MWVFPAKNDVGSVHLACFDASACGREGPEAESAEIFSARSAISAVKKAQPMTAGSIYTTAHAASFKIGEGIAKKLLYLPYSSLH